MDAISERFAQAEAALAREIGDEEIVLENDRIVFYTPKSSSAAGAYGCTIILGGWAFLLVAGVFEWRRCGNMPMEAAWVLSAVVVAGAGALIVSNWKANRSNGAFKQYKLFEIDTADEVITAMLPGPFYVEEVKQLQIASIQCFYGWHEGSGDSHGDYLCAVDDKDRRTVLSRGFFWADKYAQLLGFLCDKPAYHRNNKGEITRLSDFREEFGA